MKGIWPKIFPNGQLVILFDKLAYTSDITNAAAVVECDGREYATILLLTGEKIKINMCEKCLKYLIYCDSFEHSGKTHYFNKGEKIQARNIFSAYFNKYGVLYVNDEPIFSQLVADCISASIDNEFYLALEYKSGEVVRFTLNDFKIRSYYTRDGPMLKERVKQSLGIIDSILYIIADSGVYSFDVADNSDEEFFYTSGNFAAYGSYAGRKLNVNLITPPKSGHILELNVDLKMAHVAHTNAYIGVENVVSVTQDGAEVTLMLENGKTVNFKNYDHNRITSRKIDIKKLYIQPNGDAIDLHTTLIYKHRNIYFDMFFEKLTPTVIDFPIKPCYVIKEINLITKRNDCFILNGLYIIVCVQIIDIKMRNGIYSLTITLADGSKYPAAICYDPKNKVSLVYNNTCIKLLPDSKKYYSSLGEFMLVEDVTVVDENVIIHNGNYIWFSKHDKIYVCFGEYMSMANNYIYFGSLIVSGVGRRSKSIAVTV